MHPWQQRLIPKTGLILAGVLLWAAPSPAPAFWWGDDQKDESAPAAQQQPPPGQADESEDEGWFSWMPFMGDDEEASAPEPAAPETAAAEDQGESAEDEGWFSWVPFLGDDDDNGEKPKKTAKPATPVATSQDQAAAAPAKKPAAPAKQAAPPPPRKEEDDGWFSWVPFMGDDDEEEGKPAVTTGPAPEEDGDDGWFSWVPFMGDDDEKEKVRHKPVLAKAPYTKKRLQKLLPDTLLPPEQEIRLALTRLDNLKNRARGFERIYGRQGLGPQDIGAGQAFADGKLAFEQREFRFAILNLNHYLNQKQVPSKVRYLDAQYMLGKSWAESGDPAKALRAWHRYLATIITNPETGHGRLTDVLGSMLPLMEEPAGRSYRPGPLLAAVAGLKIPSPLRTRVLFYAGRSAALHGQYHSALDLYGQAFRLARDQRLKARIKYNLSLMEVKKKNYPSAQKLLQGVFAFQSDEAKDYRDLAALSMGRIAIYQRKPLTALGWYERVDRHSLVYKEALFEKIYLYLNHRKESLAAVAAAEYLKRFPDSDDTWQIRSLNSYFQLRAGKLTPARKSIVASDQDLDGLDRWLKENYSNRATLTQRDVRGIIRHTSAQLPQPPLITAGARLFERLQSLQTRARDARTHVRLAMYTLGRTRLEQMHPAWKNRIRQLQELTRDTLITGHRLAATQRELYKHHLSPAQKYELQASERRRLRNLVDIMEYRRVRGNWSSWAGLSDLNLQLATRHMKLKRLQGMLSSLRWLAASGKIRRSKTRMSEILELTARADEVERGLTLGVEIVRSRQVANIIQQSPHRALKAFIRDYASALYDEKALLAHVSDRYTNPGEKYLALDADKAWQRWTWVIKHLYGQLGGLEKEVRGHLNKRLATLDGLVQRYRQIEHQAARTLQTLERGLGSQMQPILAHYQSRIDLRRSLHRKWKADLDWLAYEAESDKRRRTTEKENLEKQILRENLKDLQQGALWKWPASNRY